jgi:hypothetical protein
MKKWIIILLGLMMVASCGGKDVKEFSYNPDGAQKIILASVRGSDFKELVIQKLTEKYKDDYSVVVMNLDKYEQIADKSYDVIVLMDENQAGMRFSGKVKKIADKLDQEKTILFVTAGDPDWTWEYKEYDTVSSASKPEKVEEVVQELSEKIETILEK